MSQAQWLASQLSHREGISHQLHHLAFLLHHSLSSLPDPAFIVSSSSKVQSKASFAQPQQLPSELPCMTHAPSLSSDELPATGSAKQLLQQLPSLTHLGLAVSQPPEESHHEQLPLQHPSQLQPGLASTHVPEQLPLQLPPVDPFQPHMCKDGPQRIASIAHALQTLMPSPISAVPVHAAVAGDSDSQKAGNHHPGRCFTVNGVTGLSHQAPVK